MVGKLRLRQGKNEVIFNRDSIATVESAYDGLIINLMDGSYTRIITKVDDVVKQKIKTAAEKAVPKMNVDVNLNSRTPVLITEILT